MNIELYIISILAGLLLGFIVDTFIQSTRQIRWLKTLISTQRTTIKELNDRLMSKSFDQYKMYENLTPEPPPQEPEYFFDEGAVGKISGEEISVDA